MSPISCCFVQVYQTRSNCRTTATAMYIVFLSALLLGASSQAQTQMQVYGVWHCYSDACSWASVPNMTTFDTDNHWIIARSSSSTSPSVNLVVLSFVDPVKLMNLTTDSTTNAGIPIGMTPDR